MAEYVARPGDRIEQIVDTLYGGWTDEAIFAFLRQNPRWDGQPVAAGGESFQAPPNLRPWVYADSADPYYAEDDDGLPG